MRIFSMFPAFQRLLTPSYFPSSLHGWDLRECLAVGGGKLSSLFWFAKASNRLVAKQRIMTEDFISTKGGRLASQ
jgi:hypothetical protein